MTMKKYIKTTGHFTLVELMLAMSIFAVLMLILMQIFGSTQDVWRKTGSKADSYESARIALNIISEDLANAVYVEDARGKSFHYYGANNQLWFVTKKPYTIDTNQKSLEVEVEYRLRANTTQENTDENVPSGLTLYKLEYYITTDSVVDFSSSDSQAPWFAYDFRTSTTAHTTMRTPARGILLENVLGFSVTPLYITVSGGSTVNSTNCGNFLPNMVMISLTVLDNDNAVRRRYMNASTDAEKKQISRTFVRVIPIKRGQVYNTSNLNLPSSW